jgi:hypothetical protein
VVWEGAGAQSPASDPIREALRSATFRSLQRGQA